VKLVLHTTLHTPDEEDPEVGGAVEHEQKVAEVDEHRGQCGGHERLVPEQLKLEFALVKPCFYQIVGLKFQFNTKITFKKLENTIR